MNSYSTRDLYGQYCTLVETGFKPIGFAIKLHFPEIVPLDAYNHTAPFSLCGENLLASRVEPRENQDSRVFLFKHDGDNWVLHPRWNALAMEDPFYFNVGSIPYLGGVETFLVQGSPFRGWKTVLYDISNISKPVKVFEGPSGMKDLRFVSCSDSKIGVFTRPMGGSAGRGTIGYVEVSAISELTDDLLLSAPLISSPCMESWEGVNQAHILDEQRIGLLGHVAWMENDLTRHYYAAVSEFDRVTRLKTPWRIIADRKCLPEGPAKRPDLKDVLFPAGLVREESGEAVLYLGVSDAEAWMLRIKDPFNLRGSCKSLKKRNF